MAATPVPFLLITQQWAVYSLAHQELHSELVGQPVLLAPRSFAFDNRPVAEVLKALKTAHGVDIRYAPAAVVGCSRLYREPKPARINVHIRQDQPLVPDHGGFASSN